MKNYKFLYVFFVVLMASTSFAGNMLESRIASDETSLQLKKDLYDGRLKIGKTRLKDVVNAYGSAPAITNDDKSLTLNYGDLTVQFKKTQKWKKWEYDSFKVPVYTEDAEDLRFDLESQELVGENITYERISKDYGEPTESYDSTEDGKLSIYYWGDIKLTFENQYLLQRWRSQKIDNKSDSETLTSSPASIPTPISTTSTGVSDANKDTTAKK